ncbi:unnamed protein product [Symbiodinium natans]|uniref:Uncharacterized protein n=1 Tax=Symbiodinium natans TaxID=878477 RepID=A0A812NUH7_9DINO|nr:unnamed protein product [Symbiodinium natans]
MVWVLQRVKPGPPPLGAMGRSRSRSYFPSAFIHLFCVELAPLFVMIFSFYGTIKEQGGKNFYDAIRGHKLSEFAKLDGVGDFDVMACGKDAIERMLWTGILRFQCGDPAQGTYVEEDVFLSPFAGDWSFWPLARAICVLDWWTFFTCAATVGYAMSRLCRTGERFFGSAGYLAWTWNLEQDRRFTLLIVLAAFGPIASCVYVLYFAFIYSAFHETNEAGHGMGSIQTIVQMILVAYPAKMMLIPETPIHHWKTERFAGIDFKRPWYSMFYQSNDVFGVYLVDALWRAQHGHCEKLEMLMFNSDEMHAFMQTAARLQDESDEEDPAFLSMIKGLSPTMGGTTASSATSSGEE